MFLQIGSRLVEWKEAGGHDMTLRDRASIELQRQKDKTYAEGEAKKVAARRAAIERAFAAVGELEVVVQRSVAHGSHTAVIYRLHYTEYPFDHRHVEEHYWAGFLDRRSYWKWEFTPPEFTRRLFEACQREGLSPKWEFTAAYSRGGEVDKPAMLSVVISW